MKHAVCRLAPLPHVRPGVDLALVLWRSLSSDARWILLLWGFTQATLTTGAYEAVRRMP